MCVKSRNTKDRGQIREYLSEYCSTMDYYFIVCYFMMITLCIVQYSVAITEHG